MSQVARSLTANVCPTCMRIRRGSSNLQYRPFSALRNNRIQHSASLHDDQKHGSAQDEKEAGAMSRRLADMTERNLEQGGRAAQKAVEEADFDDDLKQQLLQRLEGAKFKEENISAFAQIGTPSSAGKGTRDIAAAQAWSGEEPLGDATLRMLDDAHRKIKVPSKIPNPQKPPKRIDTGRPRSAKSTGARLANARDRTSMYSYLKDETLSEKEKEQMRKDLKDRFSPGARPMPATLQGLASLANERIEDAIARGQFKNLPRGQKIERDYNMSSPFLDTTEYFLNKMIKKQEIVPPWIEKQQELVSSANKFRSRLRVEWRRHAARLIASRGGSLESQIQTAKHYAAAEAIVNPPKQKVEQLNTVDKEGHMSQITLSGELHTKPDGSQDLAQIQVSEQPVDPVTAAPESVVEPASEPSTDSDSNPNIVNGAVFTFRDPQWEETEKSYHTAAINNLNSIARSYNLMAPDLAKKPYYNLDRELRSCFADVAPQLADAIRERAMTPKLEVKITASKAGGMLENLTGANTKVYDEQRPQYGFKEFWRDVFGSKQAN